MENTQEMKDNQGVENTQEMKDNQGVENAQEMRIIREWRILRR